MNGKLLLNKTIDSRGTAVSSPVYRNKISRLLLGRLFDQQWVLPRPVSFLEKTVLSLMERVVLRSDYYGIPIEKPIFIISLPRSGSSMLQDLMCTHADIAYISNIMHIYSPYYSAIKYIQDMLDLDVEGERFLGDSVMVNGRTPSDPVSVWGRWYNLDQSSLDFLELSISDIPMSKLHAMKREIKKILWCFNPDGGARFLSKNPGLMPYISITSEIFPDAKFIYLVRDPRQNANSMRKLYLLCERQRANLSWDEPELIPFPRLPGLKESIVKYGADSIKTTANIWNSASVFMRSWESKDNLLMVRYEDILSDPQCLVRRIMDFCEMDPAGSQSVEFKKRMSLIGQTSHKNPDYGHYDCIESICGSEMKRHGYA